MSCMAARTGGGARRRFVLSEVGTKGTTRLRLWLVRNRLLAIAALASLFVGAVSPSSSAQVVTFQNFIEAKAGTNVTSLTLPIPAGTAAGNLLIACVVTDGNNATTLSPPAGQGWNQIARNVQGTAVTLGVWWKLAGASEPSTHQWTWTALEQSYGWMMRFTGHSPTAPINISTVGGGSATSPSSPAVAPTVTETMILRIGGFDNRSITVDSPGLTTSGPHTAITMDLSNAAGGGTCSGGAGYRIQSAAGTSGASSFALTATQNYRTVTVAIAPFRCVNASECDDANVCTTDTCDGAGFCQHANNTAACTDGNACTVTDVCSGGSCVPGAPPDCSASGNQCNTASCNPAGPTGNCNTLTPVTNGTPCSDGLFCTDGDVCSAGTCQAGGARDCSSAGNQCNTGVCNETTDQCVAQPANQGNPCSDGNNCTLNETCQTGICTGGTPPNCTASDNQCNIASCNPAGGLGNCNTLTPRTNGTACNDGVFCTATDTCQTGVCGGAGETCPGEICDEFADACFECATLADCDDGVACTAEACQSGSCVHIPNNAACSDGLFCNGAETCHLTLGCQAGTSPCGDAIACTVDTCVEATDTCVYTPTDALCADALFCNGAETCSATLGCQAGSDPCIDGVACTVDSCVESTDSCEYTPINAACDDALFCNGSETCDVVLGCQPGSDPCVDGIACTVDSCTEITDTCTYTPNNALCDDALFCNGAETCSATLGCQASTDPCIDAFPCTTDACIEASDSCTNTPNDAVCDDGLYCNGAETCSAAVGCVAGSDPCLVTQVCDESTDTCPECLLPTDCDDAIACTVDTCSAATHTCVYTPSDALCDDALFCNGGETCSATLGCLAGTPPCVDAIACTADSCVENTDSCVYAPNNTACDDGLFCNGAETCNVTLGCQPGSDPCVDGIACTVDSCTELTDTCIYTPNDALCDDALFCNGMETCSAALGCEASTDPCIDAFPCTIDACVEATDSCTNTPNNAVCDDGLFCNGSEACSSTVGCVAGSDPCLVTQVCDELTDSCQACLVPADCDDANPCTVDDCVSLSCVYTPAGEIAIDLEIEGLGSAVTRDVTFEITSCGGSSETRVAPVAFSIAGTASLVLLDVDSASDWIAVREGHTLRKRAALSFTSCNATVDLTGSVRLRSGDFAAGVAAQDNLVDVTDFSILASRWNQAIAANLATGADATGDGVQGTADFTAIQVNFLTGGDATHGCALASSGRGGPRAFEDLEARLVDGRAFSVPVSSLRFSDAARADVNGDGFVDSRDIREFAARNRLPLSPAFDRLLGDAERRGSKGH